MSCYNKNTAQYKALQEKYTNPMVVDSIISKWQSANKSDEIPTLVQTDKYLDQQQVAFDLKKRTYKESLLANLSRKNIISKYQGEYFVNNTNQNTLRLDRRLLYSNRDKVLALLDHWNVPRESVMITPTPKSFRVEVDENMFTRRDVMPQVNNKNKTHILGIVQHLNEMFPDLVVNVATIDEAQEYYDSLPEWQKSKVPFNKVNSYYVNGQVVLIKGRVTAETAVEEVLHPFIDAVYSQNKSVFNGLLSEAQKMFPELRQQIDDSYTDGRGFNKTHRDLELVTQALSRHFNKEYESQPTQRWYQKLAQLLNFLMDVVKDFHNFLVGNKLVVSAGLIKSGTTLSDIAKLLNTSSLEFENITESAVDRKVRFSLTPGKQNAVDAYKVMAENSAQAQMIDQLFHAATESNEKYSDFTVGSALTGTDTPLVILQKDTHTYINIETGEEFASTTTKIKGKLNDPGDKYKINRDIGNDFDQIMEHLAELKPISELPKMNVLTQEQVSRAVDQIQTVLTMYRAQGAVIIPQVVIADGMSSTAGTIDLLAVHTDGTLQVIDLKASKNSIQDKNYDRQYSVDEGSVFYDPSLSKKDQFKLSTRMQHNMQVNTYGRILENMGYEVRNDSQTIHILVGMKGTGKNQKFTGEFKVDGVTNHKVSYSRSYVDKVVPINKDVNYAERLAEQQEQAGISGKIPLSVEEQLPQSDVLDDNTYEALFNTIKSYKEKLITRRDALILLQDKKKQSSNNQRVLSDIDNAMALINLSIIEGTVDVTYEELVNSAIKEFEDFIKYAEDPKNFNTPEYINRILNFEALAKTFQGLTKVHAINKDELNLNKRQLQLKDKLAQLINTVRGDQEGDGLVMRSVENYVRQYVVDNSNRNFTKQELDQLMTMADDIGIIEFASGDMATNKDTLLQLMDKLFKSNRQKVFDIVDARNNQVRRVASKLEALTPGGKVDYGFMLVFDKDDKFTGRYVKEIGYQYWRRRSEVLDKSKNANGEPKKYIVKDNLEDYTAEEIKYNKELKAIKEEMSRFFQAEKKVGDDYVDGDYHRYTADFKKERLKFEEWVPVGRFGSWQKKRGVSYTAHQNYRNKYYKDIVINFANYDDNNNFNGTVQEPTTIPVVKDKYKEIRTEAVENGQRIDMVDSKYSKIMNPSPTDSLAQAQKEFYLIWQEYFENDLLNKLPSGVRDQMLGKTPIIKDNTIRSAHDKGPLVASLWGKTTRGMKNLWDRTTTLQKVILDENGDPVDTLPLFYVGNPRSEALLKKINNDINQLLIDFNNGVIDEVTYKTKKAELDGGRMKIQSQPSLEELSLDMGDNLLRFSAMAENYEVMAEIEDTLLAMMKVIENRSYNPSEGQQIVANVKGKLKKVGAGKQKASDSNIVKRAKKFMSMIYYDNDKKTRGFADKVASGLIQLSSATYVGFNVFGNINNYAVGRINNAIEMFGGRYFDSKSYLRAEKEFNTNVMQDFVKRATDDTTYAGLTNKGKYKEYIPATKYQALVNLYRMMDAKADLREQNQAQGKESTFRTVLSWGYLLQDGAEYNVQTKVGIAVLMSKQIRNDKGEEMSLYDAYQYNNKTGELTLKEGYTKLVNNKPGVAATAETETVDFTDQKRYEIRNYLREVNKQIHGNYAREDRTVMQQHWLGNLAMQFHKWVAPAIKARGRKEYFDENLGWVEGRYRSFASFMGYAMKNLGEGKDLIRKYKDMKGEKALTAMTGVKRTVAEIGFMLSSFAMAAILDGLFDDDDEDKSKFARRMENALVYQMRRQSRELLFFIPLLGFNEQYMMAKSPISATRTIGELGEAIVQAAYHPFAMIYDAGNPEYNILKDKDYYYQRGSRKGQSKLGKQWGDVVPAWYTLNRWIAYDTMEDWYVK
tara:strand:- start:3075 stop:8666 length:5592 start_codon:yes stop_codon:yes gene_type:complete